MNKETEKRPVVSPVSEGDEPDARTETESIRVSIAGIVRIQIGERAFQPAAGCRLYDPVKAWLDVTDREVACEEAAGVIAGREPRVANVRVVLRNAPENEKMDFLKVSWVVQATGEYDELVLPFPLGE